MFRIARSGKANLWGDKYPPNERLGDMALHRPVELGYHSITIRFHIWDLRDQEGPVDNTNTTALSLFDQIVQLGEVRNTYVFLLVQRAYIASPRVHPLTLINRSTPMS